MVRLVSGRSHSVGRLDVLHGWTENNEWDDICPILALAVTTSILRDVLAEGRHLCMVFFICPNLLLMQEVWWNNYCILLSDDRCRFVQYSSVHRNLRLNKLCFRPYTADHNDIWPANNPATVTVIFNNYVFYRRYVYTPNNALPNTERW